MLWLIWIALMLTSMRPKTQMRTASAVGVSDTRNEAAAAAGFPQRLGDGRRFGLNALRGTGSGPLFNGRIKRGAVF